MKGLGMLLLVLGLMIGCMFEPITGGIMAIVGLLMLLLGQSQTSKPICPKCGNEIVATSKLCPVCGAKIEKDESSLRRGASWSERS